MGDAAERINPYSGDSRDKTSQVEAMFDSIAPAYDFMNSAMSFGLHRRWLRKAIGEAAAGAPAKILDVATGTADVAIALSRRLPQAQITGIDLSEGMLEVGRRKVSKAGLEEKIELQQADCLHLPMADGSFDCVTVAYGVRNFEHLLEGYKEMARVLRKGGRLVVIELSTPKSAFVKPFYKFYTRCVIPVAGRMVSKDVRAYSYLPESIAAVAQGEAMTALMQQAGLRDTTFRTMTFGVCTIYTGVR
ncbi:MAG: bifunctional demethylmenaquinone methyltransferase/2-methoxy-6-polyprenyl-1,4-benzoquinol methylase UbiE [Muribaculaceae bacterium]|nr:bifunctional demethylmenaquinone methyltransferase/2-methoxy-6-polyprenyl-1,4-benzoquinol methylase UbiE [Muribaculaceae bacterium]MDE6346884.1 bifunctional demethylmenaquinone methyltransferase/2-methoxy-6-polyprenyl-1,4-benzoquinol methylase UbiE [Muribaculaceae bacterium]